MSDVDRTCELASTGGRNTFSGHCITCSDEGVRMRVASLESELARCVGPDGEESEVDVTLVEPVAVGDELLVHAGVGLARLERGGGERSPAAGGRWSSSGRGSGGPAEL